MCCAGRDTPQCSKWPLSRASDRKISPMKKDEKETGKHFDLDSLSDFPGEPWPEEVGWCRKVGGKLENWRLKPLLRCPRPVVPQNLIRRIHVSKQINALEILHGRLITPALHDIGIFLSD